MSYFGLKRNFPDAASRNVGSLMMYVHVSTLLFKLRRPSTCYERDERFKIDAEDGASPSMQPIASTTRFIVHIGIFIPFILSKGEDAHLIRIAVSESVKFSLKIKNKVTPSFNQYYVTSFKLSDSNIYGFSWLYNRYTLNCLNYLFKNMFGLCQPFVFSLEAVNFQSVLITLKYKHSYIGQVF